MDDSIINFKSEECFSIDQPMHCSGTSRCCAPSPCMVVNQLGLCGACEACRGFMCRADAMWYSKWDNTEKSKRHVRLYKCILAEAECSVCLRVCVWLKLCSTVALAVRLQFKVVLFSHRSVLASVTEKQDMASHALSNGGIFTLWFF